MAAALRGEKGLTHLSFSQDDGRTWTKPSQVTGKAEHPADLLVLADGSLLMSYGVRHQPYGVQAMLSRDEGASWERNRKILLAWDGDHGDLGYPVSVQRADGKIVTAYYIVYGEQDTHGYKGIAMKNSYTKTVIWSLPH